MNKDRIQRTACRAFLTIATLVVCIGCDQSAPTVSEKTPVAKATPASVSTDVPPVLTADELRRRLGTDERARFRRIGTEVVEAHLAGTGVQSIEALKGLPLRVLDLGFCRNIDDISVLAGMPLKTLILEGTSVGDLSPIAGMSLETLHLQDTPVTDLSMLKGMPLKQLNLKGVSVNDVTLFAEMPLSTIWLPETDISNIDALRGMSLESLDIQNTVVSNLDALAHMTTLRRLNIAGTKISDLRPVTGLKLERIFLSPEQITHGMAELRKIPSLGKIGTSHEHQFASADFWERYDVGAWHSEQPNDSSASVTTSDAETKTPSGSPDPATTPE